jgi:hypothetical protein
VIPLAALVFVLPLVILNRRDMQDDDSQRRKRANWTSKLAKIILFSLFLLYPGMSSKTLGFFACKEVNGVRYLMSDFSVECGVQRWNSFLPYAVTMVC